MIGETPRLLIHNERRWQWIKTIVASIALAVFLLVLACGKKPGGDTPPQSPAPTPTPTGSLCGTVQPTGACPNQGLAGQDLASVCRCADDVTGGTTMGALEAVGNYP